MKTLRNPLFLVTLLVATGCGDAARDETGAIQTAGALDAFAMRPGDCFDDSFFTAEEVSDLPGVPCVQPHDNEVYATFDVDGEEYPGADRMDELADGGCLDRFEAAIGAPYQESVLVFTTLTPSEASWSERNDREVVCVAYHMELEKLTGSVLGSGM
jgi:hypothetical protein